MDKVLQAKEIIDRAIENVAPHSKIYATSSFQTQSVPLLHIIKEHRERIEVVFIDTGFLFAETYRFVNDITALFNLNITTVKSVKSYKEQLNDEGLFHYADDVDRCCNINKVVPLQNLLNVGDIWISGVRRDQTSVRKQMEYEDKNDAGVILVHPMLDWNAKDVYDYIKLYNLPKHPLDDSGYMSIGCVPCTHKWLGEGRGGRWVGKAKTECGLHVKQSD